MLTRNPCKASLAPHRQLGIELCEADLDDPATLTGVADGCTGCYVHSTAGDTKKLDTGEVRRAQHLAAALREAGGISHVVYNSAAAEDSHDQTPLLRGDGPSSRTIHIHNTFENQYAIRQGDWLLVDAKNGYRTRGYESWEAKRDYPADNDLPFELYNLREDLEQRNNLASAKPDKVDELKALLAQIRNQGFSAPRLVE